MNYPPKIHQDTNREHLLEVIKNYPLATLVSVKDNEPLITHLPLIIREEDQKLIGHIDIYNPQAELLKNGNAVTVLFYGPQCYISPAVYTTSQLPTYNYIRVHLKGTVEAIESVDALRDSLISMTEFLEQPDQKFVLERDNPKMAHYINYIKMFEISITHWEGKFKLSQDKKPQDMENAKQELIRSSQESIQKFLDKILK
ncbi:MAG: FMN-binding negative transcriptional regulator [Flavobacteriaceae bacterium]